MNLNEKAMLARLPISQWTGRKLDKKANKETADKHQADADQLSTSKYLVAKNSLEKIAKIAGAAKAEFYRLSLPWTDEGERVISSVSYFELAKKYRTEWKPEFEAAVDEFCAAYPALAKQAKTFRQNGSLGTLHNDADYPTENNIRERFSIDFTIRPIPESSDFRVKLSDAEAKMLRQQIEQQKDAATETAMKEVWKRIHKVLAHMSDRLHAYKVLDKPVPTGSTTKKGNQRYKYVEGSFEDSLVTNISDLLDVLPALNLTDNPDVAQVAKDMRKLCKYSADQLKENDGLRSQIADSADDILKKMSSFV